MRDLDLAAELEPDVARAVDRHLSVARDWMPHDYVPWERGRDLVAEPYDEGQSGLPAPVRAAVQLNLLTEDNLPGYHREISRAFGADGAWRTWQDRWTAEEGRHAIVLRDYLVVTRAVDPDVLEQERMATVCAGFYATEKDLLRTLAYVSMQELATRVAHRGTGLASGDPGLDRLLARVAADENLHMVFYRELFLRALELVPTQALQALVAEVEGFAMPGTGVPGFVRKAALVARAGIYDLRVHRDDVVGPLLRHWEVLELTGLDAAGEQARERLVAALEDLDRRISRVESRRERVSAAAG